MSHQQNTLTAAQRKQDKEAKRIAWIAQDINDSLEAGQVVYATGLLIQTAELWKGRGHMLCEDAQKILKNWFNREEDSQ